MALTDIIALGPSDEFRIDSSGNMIATVEDASSDYTGTLIADIITEIGGRLGSRTIADPGDAGAIAVTSSGVCAMTSAGAETRTLAIPAAIGQRIVLVADTYVGDIVVTVEAPVNVANNNTLTFGAVSEACELVAVTVGGSLVWQIGWNDGVGLTTV